MSNEEIRSSRAGANLRGYVNTHLDYQSELIRAMAMNGIVPRNDIYFDDFGEIVRFGVIGDKPSSKNGWAILFPHGRGVFGSWKLNISIKWFADSCKSLTREERKNQLTELNKYKKSYEDIKHKRQSLAAEECIKTWESSEVATDFSHKYLIEKGIKANGVRQIGELLLLPLTDIWGNLLNIQSINSFGLKKFHFGAAVSGNFMVLGELVGKVYVVEGFATGATIHEVSGENVAVAFNVGNLVKVVSSLKKNNASLELIIAADNDRFSQNNIGLSTAIEVSKKFHIGLVYPKFEGGQVGSDFNDLARYFPSDIVLDQLQEKYDAWAI